MPIYEYQCSACCHCFEEIVFSSKAQKPKCPECGCTEVKKLISAGCIRAHGIPSGSGGFKATACKPTGA